MARKSKKPASRGSVNNIILEILSEGEKYGYEIIKEVEEKTEGKIVLKQPSLYSSLSRFEEKNYVTSTWKESSIGGRRHYYKLTELGMEIYKNLKNKSNQTHTPVVKGNNNPSNNPSKNEDDVISQNQDDSDIFSLDNVSTLESESVFDIEDTQSNEFENINETSYDSYKIKNYSNFDVSNKLRELLEDDVEQNETDLPEQHNNDLISESNLINIAEPTDIDEKIEELELNIENEKNNQVNNNLKEMYSTIKENKTKEENDICDYYETSSPSPLSYLEAQKRKASMEILYGNDIDNYYAKTNNQNSLSQNEEQIDFEKYINLKNSFNDKRFLYNKTKCFIKKEKPYIFKTLYIERKNTNNYVINSDKNNKDNKIKYQFDEFGIMKIANTEDATSKKQASVIDNVGYRSYNDFWHNPTVINKQKNNIKQPEIIMSDEEIEHKNKKFKELFNKIAEEKYTTTPEKNDQESKLNDISSADEKTITNDNSFNFKEDNFVEFSFEKNNEQPQDLTNNLSTDILLNNKNNTIDNQIKIKTYGEANSYITEDSNRYICINKIRFIHAIIFSLFIILQTTALLFILKGKNLLSINDFVFYQISYAIAFVIILINTIPLIINKNKVTENNFNLTYSCLFSLILFVVVILLTYALNTLFGFNFTNINNYISSIVIPVIWGLTSLISPIIYKLILINKKLHK